MRYSPNGDCIFPPAVGTSILTVGGFRYRRTNNERSFAPLVLGAIITGGVTLGTTYIQGKRDRAAKRDAEKQAAAEQAAYEKARAESNALARRNSQRATNPGTGRAAGITAPSNTLLYVGAATIGLVLVLTLARK